VSEIYVDDLGMSVSIGEASLFIASSSFFIFSSSAATSFGSLFFVVVFPATALASTSTAATFTLLLLLLHQLLLWPWIPLSFISSRQRPLSSSRLSLSLFFSCLSLLPLPLLIQNA
jgi:hypothetical protein